MNSMIDAAKLSDLGGDFDSHSKNLVYAKWIQESGLHGSSLSYQEFVNFQQEALKIVEAEETILIGKFMNPKLAMTLTKI